jgi:putative two-component system response regulator
VTKILIVDDVPDNVELLTVMLERQGYETFSAHSGRDALAIVPTERPDAVLLDVMMPGMSGIEVCRRLKGDEDMRRIPIILVTAKDLDEDVVQGFDAGADDYVTKPVNGVILAARLRSALRLKQSCDAVVRANAAIRSAHEETIYRLLSASRWRDEETGMHIRRVGLLSEVLAKTAGWSTSEAENIRLAAPMHDVGKIGIPDAVLRKPGKLFLEEFEVMKQHTVIGAQILAGSDVPMLQMAQAIALNHHERWDGEGYPAGLAGHAIPESARIVAIVDVYDAMTHDRVYRPAMPEEKALAIMQKGAGTQFDPLLLAVFFSQLAEINSIARENEDETAATAPGGRNPIPPWSREKNAPAINRDELARTGAD